jgi:hypothetical protein
MRLISTREGYASLSQFQIMLWSFLFGAGAVYVMGLSGGLINIPTGALVLLCIAGKRECAKHSERGASPRQHASLTRNQSQDQCAVGQRRGADVG